MIFRSLEIENFRQFGGTQKIEFSVDSQRNVTVIHGYNGAGKTTLLNTFIWLFHNRFSEDFSDVERLANEAAWSKMALGEDLLVSVKARFEHNANEYVAERFLVVTKISDEAQRIKTPSTLKLSFKSSQQGELYDVKNPEDHIKQILPLQLAPFFFFNGERIERLASATAYENVENGIKVLLDIELLERSIKHLRAGVAEKFRNEIADGAGAKGKQLGEKRDDVLAITVAERSKYAQQISNRNALEQEREKIDSKLRAQPELAGLQKERDEKSVALRRVRNELEEVGRSMAAELSRNGYLPLGHAVLNQALTVLNEAHSEGELPPPMKRQFVEELLNRNSCICARDLDADSDARKHVEVWRDKSATDEFARITISSRAEISGTLRRRTDEFWNRLDEFQNRRASLRKEDKELDERLSEISGQIGEKETQEDYSGLENRRRSLENSLRVWELEAAEQRKKIKDLEVDANELDRQIRQLEQAGAQGRLALKRLDAVMRVANALENIRDIRQEVVREDVSQSISRIWNSISIKNYTAQLTPDYRLELKKDVGGQEETVRGVSTGEKQVLSLAFVASLAQKAQEIWNESRRTNSSMFVGGLYPLVMDSPFGNLEVSYRRDVARYMPQLAPQIIIMVSESQWRNEVESELESRVGKSWILLCHTTTTKEKVLTIRGHEYPYVTFSDDGYEKTSFVEIQ